MKPLLCGPWACDSNRVAPLFQALFKAWGPGGRSPKDVLLCTELVLDPQGGLVQMNRLPGDNEVMRAQGCSSRIRAQLQ